MLFNQEPVWASQHLFLVSVGQKHQGMWLYSASETLFEWSLVAKQTHHENQLGSPREEWFVSGSMLWKNYHTLRKDSGQRPEKGDQESKPCALWKVLENGKERQCLLSCVLSPTPPLLFFLLPSLPLFFPSSLPPSIRPPSPSSFLSHSQSRSLILPLLSLIIHLFLFNVPHSCLSLQVEICA